MQSLKSSREAAFILKAFLFTTRDRQHRGLISPEAALWSERMALRVISSPSFFLFAIGNSILRNLLSKLEQYCNPGFILHVASRKRFIGDLGRKEIESGVSQVLIIGAGYDTFGLRNSLTFPNVQFFEIDHPGTQNKKLRAVRSLALPQNLHFLPADLLATPLDEIVRRHPKFDRSKETLVVVEGVLMYWSERRVRAFFDALASVFQSETTCIFTFMNRGSDGSVRYITASRLLNLWLSLRGDAFRWGIERDRLSGFMTELGFQDAAVFGKSDLMAAYFEDANPPPSLAVGELIGLARLKPNR